MVLFSNFAIFTNANITKKALCYTNMDVISGKLGIYTYVDIVSKSRVE